MNGVDRQTASTASLSDIAAAVRAGSISARELTLDRLAAIEASQETLNAFTLVDRERALARADAIDQAVADREDPGPLAGVPIGVKDLIDHEGRVNTRGSSFDQPPARSTAPTIAALERAGAVIVGRTGLHEFAFGFSSENPWFGPVRNPWNPGLSPGGSSGGSASAVAAGLVAGSLGTDTGGSVRVPAALCGIVGLKVTHGRVSIRGVFPLAESIDTIGPLARTVSDLGKVYETIAFHDPQDPWSVPVDIDPRTEIDIGEVRFGIPKPWTDTPMAGDVVTSFSGVLDAIADAGGQVLEVEVPDLHPAAEMTASYSYEVAALHRDRLASDDAGYGQEVAARIQATLRVTGLDYLEALRWRARIRNAAAAAFREVDVLVTPTTAATRKVIGSPDMDLDGESVHYRLPLSHFSAVVNHASLPAIALPLPSGTSPPGSVQMIGPPWSETTLLDIGSALERAGIVRTERPPVFFD